MQSAAALLMTARKANRVGPKRRLSDMGVVLDGKHDHLQSLAFLCV